MALKFKSTININNEYTLPSVDGSAGQVITTDGSGNLSFQSANDSGSTLIHKDLFTGDNSTVEFTLANSVDDEVKTQVYFDGVYQSKENYTVSGNVITFSTAPPSGTDIEVITFNTVLASDYNQELKFYGKAVGSITKGDAVMFAGAQGDHFLISKATQVALEDNHEYFLGLAAQDFADNEYGYVVEFGRLEAMDTSDYTAGDILWFDSEGTIAGAVTTTEPTAPNTKIQIAAVVRVHQNEGVIFVRPTIFHELSESTDVSITSVSDKDLLVWDAVSGVWENSKSVDTLLANTLTATTLSGTLSTAAQTNITSVGTLSSLTVSGTSTLGTIQVRDAGSYLVIGATTADGSDNDTLYITGGGDASGARGSIVALQGNEAGGNLNFIAGRETGAYINFLTGTGSTERLRIDSSGNVGIGTSSSGGGYKLNVLGLARFGDTDTSLRLGQLNSTTTFIQSLKENGTAADLVFYNTSERLRIDSSGNIGIGTSSPNAKLEVQNRIRIANANTSGFASSNLDFFSYDGSSIAVGGSIFQTSSTFVYQQIGANQLNIYAQRAGGLRMATGNSAPIIFATGAADLDFSTERLRIDSSGNVGINNSSPNISGFSRAITLGGADSGFEIANSGVITAILSGNTQGASISGVGSSGIRFNTSASGSTTERMRITSGGSVLIGTQTAQSGAQGGGANILTLKSAGNNWGVGPSTSFGNFYVVNNSNVGVYLTSGATSWISLSDERQKDIIENIENAIDKISNWRTVVGKYKNDSEETRRSFLIAQDVLDTFPEAVDTSLEENYGLRYSDTIPVLVKAIQEQQEIINDLKSEVELLKSQING